MSSGSQSKEVEALQAKFQAELEKFTKIQKKHDKLIRSHGQLDTQINENQMVKDELGFCKEDAKVFKLLGDILVPQTLNEARSNVDRRMEYIQSELKRNSEVIQTYKTEMGALRETIAIIEPQLQKMMQAQGKL